MPDAERKGPSQYYNTARIESRVAAGRHRETIGGMWDEMGELQFRFLVEMGLRPEDRVLDVGCGALRAGVHLVRYLAPANYFGIDLQPSLLDAGYDLEIAPAGLESRLPRDNLRATDRFEASFAAPVDVALAVSVFTHLPWNYLRWCLEALEEVVRVGGRFFATYFEIDDDEHFSAAKRHTPGGVVTQPASDPYHYRSSDIAHAAAGTQWSCEIIGAWGHPRDQRMAAFTRLAGTK